MSFISGIGLGGIIPEAVIGIGLIWFGAVIFSLACTIIFWRHVFGRTVFLAALFLFAGLWRYNLNLPQSGPEQISFYNNRKIELTGAIISEPDERIDQVRYEVGKLSSGQLDLSGKLLLVGTLMPTFSYGDRISFKCKLKKPKDFDEFNYSRYLARYDIYSICYFPQITSSRPAAWRGPAENFFGWIYKFKSYLRQAINLGLPEPEASLANGMILGDQKGLSPDIRAQFGRTGLSHIIAISGMNITIIAAFISWLIISVGLSRRSVFYLTGLIICLYIVLIGLPASAVRAGLISVMLLYAAKIGRLNKITNSLFFAAALMLVFSPRLLRDDLGFILSFLAILSLVFFYEPTDRWLAGLSGGRHKLMRQAVSLTLAAQILTWPVMAYNFSQISVVAPLANLAALWTLPFLTAAIFLVLPLACLWPSISAYLFIPARLFLKYLLITASLFGDRKWAAVSLDFRYPLAIIVYYGVIVWFLTRRSKTAETRQ